MMKKLLCSLLFTVLAVGAINAQNVFGDVSGGSPLTVITTTTTSATTNTPDPNEGTDFGTTTVGNSVSQTFTFTSSSADSFFIGIGSIIGDDPSEFNNDSPVPSSISGVGATSTFVVNFEPTSAGAKSAIIEVRVTNQSTFLIESYFFEIAGNAGAATPNIAVTGDNSQVLIHPDLSPGVGDDNYYGDVVVGQTVTRQFTVQNTGNAILTLTDIDDIVFNEADFDIVLPPGIVLPPVPPSTGVELNPLESFTFSIEFTPSSTNSINEIIRIFSDDPDTPVFVFEVLGNGIPATPDMDVLGNGTLIVSGDNSPSTADHTVFPTVDIDDGGVTRTFTIENNGTANLNLTSLSPVVNITGADAGDFTVTVNPTTPILPNEFTTFTVTFDPSDVTPISPDIKEATIEISNNGVDNPYTFAIQGTATDDVTGGPFDQLMITQYYEGTGSNKWIEVKNISSTATIPGAYFIGLYLNTLGTIGGGIQTNTPISYQINFAIPAGGVVLFGNSAAATPAAINRGSAITINDGTADNICSFTGNDIIIITTSSDGTAYNNRKDIMGIVSQTSTAIDWGTDVSLIKGCGTIEQPAIVYDPANINYDPNQFIQLTLEEVNSANPNTNIALGTQTVGSTTWTSSWNNGIPDKTKSAIIAGTYSNGNGSLEACDLTINSGASINLDSGGTGSNYVLVDNNLTINGTFTIGDTESLITTKEDATISGSITKIERTTPLNNFRDYTYWSSPVNTTIASAFTGVDPNRIWLWRTPVDQSSPGAGDGDPGNWENASGTMQAGRGYLAEAPSTITPGQQHQVNFTGTPHNGVVNVPVGIDTGQGQGFGGYNIIGNPYPSAIDIDIFIEEQANPEIDADPSAVIDGTIWLWSHNTPIADNPGSDADFVAADYATYNLAGGVGTGTAAGGGLPVPTNIIGSGQGFLVQVFQVGNNAVTFENYMRVKDQNDTQFFKSNGTNKADQEKDRIWLDMTSDEGAFNQILVGFFDKATDGFDKGYDGRFVSGGNTINFYSNLEDDIYAIQGLGAFDESKEVSLGFYASKAKTYTISMSKIEGILKDEDVYLVDNELNVVHDLKQGDYQFEVLTAGNYQERFTLKFNSGVLSTDTLELNNSFIVYNENATLKIKSGVEIAELKVYDITGRLLIDFEPKSAAFDVPSQNINGGTVLILNATMSDGSVISKKAIKF